MKIEDIKENYYFETLNENHDLSYFDCGDEDLNDFLKKDALIQQEKKLNLTKLVICDDVIIGFVSLLTDTLLIKNIREERIKLDLRNVLNINSNNKHLPAVKIGRFALDKRYSGQGLGTHILRNVLATIKKISETNVGFRFIVVEGYAKSFNFYVAHNGFENLKRDDVKIDNMEFISKRDPNKTFYLYLDLDRYDLLK